ncbi:hypothetical protein [Auritidibacter ignavus]|uniref:Uncharacterized protein n=1 Tax=Auritidibacter ignavus TaxID=678932 RepID=A0AAJ6AN00_9MICC|nr:hypothetical protein [Auritidibacter ignavus]WGH84478.1 hypothetical protein QDX20_02825 [Auritidibacter ignavus]WGH93803.1 hypothetical protein QDX21_03115 [Auritidibacter ignavus]WHS34770.1 hypothetical protein QM403_10755 [Auritidibacter ignavus]
MSVLEKLRGLTLELSADTQRTGESLSAYSHEFNKQRVRINDTLRGSTQRKDQELMATVDDAERQVRQAVLALQRASRVARDYAHNL